MKSIQKVGMPGVELSGRQIQGTINSHLWPVSLRTVFPHEVGAKTDLAWVCGVLGLWKPHAQHTSSHEGVLSTDGHTHVCGSEAVRLHPTSGGSELNFILRGCVF